MRTYKGLGGNTILLNSSHIIAETQFIREDCPMDKIRDVSYFAPNFTRNGCITITTANNVIPIYFTQHTTPMMLEAFSILSALAKDNEKLSPPELGKDGKKIGVAYCRKADNSILKDPGKMKVYQLENAFRFEYNRVDQGCTISFDAIMKLEAYNASNILIYSVAFPGLQTKGNPQGIINACSMVVVYKEKDKKRKLIFDDKSISDLFGTMTASLIKRYTIAQ